LGLKDCYAFKISYLEGSLPPHIGHKEGSTIQPKMSGLVTGNTDRPWLQGFLNDREKFQSPEPERVPFY
jgi:hypothetical protein